VVTDRGGPQSTVRHESSGYIAQDCDEFAAYTARLMSQPDCYRQCAGRLGSKPGPLRGIAFFEGMYEAYARCLSAAPVTKHSLLDVATS